MKFVKIGTEMFEELKSLHKDYKVAIEEDVPSETELERLRKAIEQGHILFYGCICAAEQPSVLNGLSSCLFIRVLIDFGMLTGLSTPLLAIINTLFKMPKSKK